MARLPLRHEEDPATDPKILAALDRIGASGFPALNVFRALANKPEALDGFMAYVMSIYNTNTGAVIRRLPLKKRNLRIQRRPSRTTVTIEYLPTSCSVGAWV